MTADPTLIAALVDIAAAIHGVGMVLAVGIGSLGVTIALSAVVRK